MNDYYPIRGAGHRGSIMRSLLKGQAAGVPDRGMSPEQVPERLQSIRNATPGSMLARSLLSPLPVASTGPSSSNPRPRSRHRRSM